MTRVADYPYVMHIDRVDGEAVALLKERPDGVDTMISLYSLQASDDVSSLDSRVLSVGGAKPIDLSPLYRLSAGVEHLAMVGAVISGRQRLRVGDLQHVRTLAADWAALDLTGGFGSSLRRLSIDTYGREGLTDLAVEECDRIEHLCIVRSRTLTDLSALEAFSSLSRLELYGCRQLVDFSPLALLPSLRHLEIEACRRLHTVEGLLPPRLETLVVTDCGTIDSIKVIADYPTLQRVAFNGDTLIEDRDLTPLLRLPQLHSVLVASRRGYHPSGDELSERFNWRPLPDLL